MSNIFKLFLSILSKKQKKQFIGYILILFVGSISSVFGIGAVIPFITVLIQPDKLSSISLLQGYSYHQLVLFFSLALIVAFWLKNIISTCLLLYQTKFLNSLVASIQIRLFRSYMSMSYEAHLNRSTPDLIRNINNETNQLSNGVINPLGLLITDVFSTFFIVVVLLYLSFVFSSLIIVTLGLFLFVFMKTIRKKISEHGHARSESWTAMTKDTLNGLTGIKEIKLYHNENVFINSFDKKAKILAKASMFNRFYNQFPRFLIETIAITFVLMMLVISIYAGESAIKLFVLLSVFGVASAQLLPALNRIMSSLTSIRYSSKALENVYNELNKTEEGGARSLIKDCNISRREFNSKINLENISYNYPDGTQALKDVSLTIEKDKKTAFIGASGAGKSTLVDLILGFHTPSSGQLYLDEKLIESREDWLGFQKLFAYIPQQIILYDASIRENIAFGTPSDKIDDEKVWRCLEMTQMFDFVKDLKESINTFVGEDGVRISGGQRQRIGIARALYQDPQILVMDEATSALDNATEKEVTNVINGLDNITIITIAHRLSTIEGYDVVYRLENGMII